MPRAKSATDVLEAARLYYKEEQTKDYISKKMKIDARTVTALLKRAREEGIVDIRIREDVLNLSLEQQLKARFRHLERVLTLPRLGPIGTPEQHGELIRRLGVLSAQYFEDFMAKHHGPVHLAVSGGVSVFEIVNAIERKPRPNLFIHVTAIVGYGMLDKDASHLIPAANASLLWEKSGRNTGSHLSYATAAPLGPLPPDLDELAKNNSVRDVLNDMEKINFVLAGLGTVVRDKHAPPLRRDVKTLRNQLSMTELLRPLISLRELKRLKAIGDFSYNLYGADGEELMNPKSATSEPLRFFLTPGYGKADQGLAFYRQLVKKKKPVLAIAGPFKLEAIRAALKGKLMNIWVTDEQTAQEVLEMADKDETQEQGALR